MIHSLTMIIDRADESADLLKSHRRSPPGRTTKILQVKNGT
jgi:hypothetical protein